LYGFAAEVHRRLVAAEAAAAEQADASAPTAGPAVALVLAGRRHRVDAAFAEAFPRLASARRTVLSGSGYAEGALAGERADLGRVGRVGGGSRRALGA
jgi:hypothetical protein